MMATRSGPTVQRGMMTVGQGGDGRRTAPPVILRRAEPAPVQPGEVYGYVTSEGRFAQLRIVTLRGEDDVALRAKYEADPRAEPSADETLTRACLAHVPDGFLQFADYAYGTRHRAVADFIDDRIRRGVWPNVARDSQQMKLRCAHTTADGEPCPFTVFRTENGLRAMDLHVLEEHDRDDYWQPPAPDAAEETEETEA